MAEMCTVELVGGRYDGERLAHPAQYCTPGATLIVPFGYAYRFVERQDGVAYAKAVDA